MNVKEFYNHRLVDYPHLLKCRVCGQDMKIPMSAAVWEKHGDTIEANVKAFRELHNNKDHKKDEQ